MLNLELLVALWGHLYLITDAIVDLGLALGGTSDYLVCKECLIDDAIEWAGCSKVLVVNV